MNGAVLLTVIAVLVFTYAMIYVILIAIRRQNSPRSSDGHLIPPEKDITCNRFGHRHEQTETEAYTGRYIVHEDPETGYVILNGIKRRITDCKYL
jgi:hypothetical protein